MKVAALRSLRGLTQEDLAHRAGISRNQVQNIEHSRGNQRGPDGRPKPGNAQLDTVFALAEVLDVSVVQLIDPGVSEAELVRLATQG